MLLVYDVNARQSFDSLLKWLIEIQSVVETSLLTPSETELKEFWSKKLVYLIGNKVCDIIL